MLSSGELRDCHASGASSVPYCSTVFAYQQALEKKRSVNNLHGMKFEEMHVAYCSS